MEFTWSFSSLKDFINCPKQYHEVKVLKRVEKSTTKQMLYGTEVHKACEDYRFELNRNLEVGEALVLYKCYIAEFNE